MWILCLALIVSLLIVIDTVRLGISPMPTSRKVRASLFSLISRKTDCVVYELGCGFGFLALSVARNFPKAKVIAFEKALIPYLVSKGVSCFATNLTVKYQDIFTTDLTQADFLITYLFPGAMKRLSEKKMRGILLSHTFRLPGNEPRETFVVNDLYRTKVFSYSFEKIEG